MVHIQGAYTAIVTPFKKGSLEVDYEALGKIVERQIAAGITGLVPVGTTGECPTLNHDEHKEVIEFVVKTVNKRVQVIAGTGSNSTAEAVALTQHAKEVGVDAALVVNPYYNKPSQEGLYQHFLAIDKVGLPIVLYNIPARCGVMMTPATVARLAELENIVAIKEATGSMDQTSEIIGLCPGLPVLSGDDSLTLPIMSLGGAGCVSVLSNLAPTLVAQQVSLALNNDWAGARAIHAKLFKLSRAMFIDTNPIPVKEACEAMDLCTAEVRLPMTRLSEEAKKTVCAALEAAGEIS